MKCMDCGRAEVESESIYHCPECGESYVGEVAAKVIDSFTQPWRAKAQSADAMAKAVEEYRVAQKRMCSVQWDASQDSVTAAAEVYEAADEALDAALSAYRRAGGAL